MKIFLRMPKTIWVLGFVSLFMDISSGMVQSLLPLFLVTTLGANILTVGIIEAVAAITVAIVKIFSGTLSDYLGKRKELALVGYGLSAIAKPLFAIAINPVWVFIAYFGDRVGKGIRVAPRDALIADAIDLKDRGAAYGLRQSLDTIGGFLGPILAFSLMSFSNNNFRFVFATTLIPGLLSVGCLAIGVKELKQKSNKSIEVAKNNPFNFKILTGLSQEYWLLVIVAFIFGLGNYSNAFLLLRAEEIGISPSIVPLTLVVTNIAYFFSAYPAGILSDCFDRTKILIGGFLLYGLVYFGFALVQTPGLIWILFALYGIHLGTNKGILAALIADRVPTSLRGTAFGFFNLAVGLSIFLASILAGLVWQLANPSLAFAIGGLFAVLATLILSFPNLLIIFITKDRF
ncbi:MAG: MFS transporter [Prochloraceae cyanobacterium]|nr:MFS transporter [Prochloraceae cyanobacterium]